MKMSGCTGRFLHIGAVRGEWGSASCFYYVFMRGVRGCQLVGWVVVAKIKINATPLVATPLVATMPRVATMLPVATIPRVLWHALL